MTAMDELATFLSMRLDEEAEAATVAAALARTPWTSTTHTVRCGDGYEVALVEDGEPAITKHIARWHPARVLAEVEAKRRLLDEVVPEIDGMDERINGEWGIGSIAEDDYASVPLLKLLAQPYADHPDYREEWRP